MDVSTIVAFGSALIIGVVLGLVGGGGSILTVPVLVYLLGIEPVIATAYSLFVVGSAAVVGAVRNMQQKMVDVRTAFVFAVPAFIAVYATRRYLIPAIPESLGHIGSMQITKDVAIMLFFAVIMLLAAIAMIRNRSDEQKEESVRSYNYPLIIIEGLVVGVLTGIVGAGGGFLIIPALVLLAQLPMKKAVGTSLLIIAFKSLIGFIGDIQNVEIDWRFLLAFTAFAIVGILVGIYLARFINGKRLKTGFGYFVLLIGIYIIGRELS